jgi:hypothetical protein
MPIDQVPRLETLQDNQTCQGAYEYFAPFWQEELRLTGEIVGGKPFLARALRK